MFQRHLLHSADDMLRDAGAESLRHLLRLDPVLSDAWAGAEVAVATRGQHRLLEPHAEGGLGLVWLARDEVLGRTVALKEIKPTSAAAAETRARFIREARITGRLEHPYIIPVHASSVPGRSTTPSRLVRGVTLSDAIENSRQRRATDAGQWPLARLLEIFKQVCQAVAFAHATGVVHRDLKPANVVIGDFGQVFVLDWGLAKELGAPSDDIARATTADCLDSKASCENPNATRAGLALGTPAFMSPEQASGRSGEVGPASDIYSLAQCCL